MKAYSILIFGSLLTLAACRGDHPGNQGRDTAQHHYNTPSNIDSSKVNTPGSDAGLDNSGSGGTAIAKDSSQMKKDKK